MRSVLIDDRGEMWDAGSRRLADDLQASITGEELTDFAIRNMGFVGVAGANGSVRVSLRPAVVSPIAFAALLYWLNDRVVDRVLLSLFDRSWSHEIKASREDAVRALLARVTFGSDSRAGDFLQQDLPLHALPARCPLQGVLAVWSEASGKFDGERVLPMLENVLNGRFVLVEASTSSPALVIKDVGPGLAKPAEYWLARSIGNRVEDQPDYAYGKWIAGLYRQVLNNGAPSLSDVDAVISWPQHSRERFRYRRLVVPFDGGRNSTVLLGASLSDPGINLRVKPG